MTTYHVDYENGSNSNDGSSWASAWATIYGNTVADNDTIKVAKSRDPFSIGNATWTNSANTITLASSQTYLLEDGDDTWTLGSFTAQGTSTTYCSDTIGKTFSVPSSVSAGALLAYKALGGAVDLSSYQELTFWYYTNSSTRLSGDSLVIELCSDTAGTTVVDSFKIPAIIGGGGGYRSLSIKRTGGGNLGSSIQSIAISCDQAFSDGAFYFYIDEISACKTDGIKLNSLISKSSSATSFEWYPIRSINGTTVSLSQTPSYNSSSAPTYYGTTETVTTYVRDPINVDQPSQTIYSSIAGIDGVTKNLVITGGWNTASNTVDGITFLGSGYCLYILETTVTSIEIDGIGVHCAYKIIDSTNTYDHINIELGNFGTYAVLYPIYQGLYSAKNLTICGSLRAFYGGVLEAGIVSIFSAYSVTNVTTGTVPLLCYIDTLNCYSINYEIFQNRYITNYLYINHYNSYNSSINPEFLTDIGICTNFLNSFVIKIGQVNGYPKHIGKTYNIVGQAATAGGTGTEWKISVTDAACIEKNFLMAKLQIATVAVEEDKEVTVKVYIKKSSASGIGAKIYVPAFQVGLTEPEEQAAPNDTNRNQVTLQFTPTETGVVKIFVAAWYISSTSDNVIVDDVEISQVA